MNPRAVRWSCLLFAAAACRATPPDPLLRAERALAVGDLLSALTDLDGVPVAHPRYPQARTIAAQIERRLRKSHEHLLAGLLLRSEWRDAEAVAAFEAARQTWPALPAIDGLIVATERRQRLFPEATEVRAAPPVPPTSVASTQPVEEDGAGGGERDSPAAELALAETAGVPAALAAAPAGEIADTPIEPVAEVRGTVATVDEVVAARLAAIEEALSAGRMDSAVGDLMGLFRQCPDDPRVKRRLARVLLQRGLVRYGRGDQVGAGDDWRRAYALDPTSPAATLLTALGN